MNATMQVFISITQSIDPLMDPEFSMVVIDLFYT